MISNFSVTDEATNLFRNYFGVVLSIILFGIENTTVTFLLSELAV
jgi:hypothetical protein